MYTFDSRIRYSECDSEGFLTMESLLDYFQDCTSIRKIWEWEPVILRKIIKPGF